MTIMLLVEGFRKEIENSFGEVAQFKLTAVEDVGDGGKIMLAEVNGMQVWDYLPVRRGTQDHDQEFPADKQKSDFFGKPLADAFADAAREAKTLMAVSALDALINVPPVRKALVDNIR